MSQRPTAQVIAIAAALLVALGAIVFAVAGDRPSPSQARVEAAPYRPVAPDLAALRLEDVAGRVGLVFRQGAFRYPVSSDPIAMMGGGLCWLDYDDDGWLDLYVVNSYAEREAARWEREG